MVTVFQLGPMGHSEAKKLMAEFAKVEIEFDLLKASELDRESSSGTGNASQIPESLDSYTPKQEIIIQVVTGNIHGLNQIIEPFGYPPFEGAAEEVQPVEEFTTGAPGEVRYSKEMPGVTEDHLDAKEFVCPRGDFYAPSLRLCPRHGLKLIEFSVYVERQRQLRQKVFMVISILALLAYGFVAYLKYLG